ncbi:MAG: hypothetical protein ACI8W7_002772, partial [Gammaproteobacteria bacterium]
GFVRSNFPLDTTKFLLALNGDCCNEILLRGHDQALRLMT